MSERQFIFVVGPTASGKSDVALQLAEKNKGVIFNCDSVQLYTEVNIGAAKPTLEERQRVPHYLLDVVTPPQEITSGDYRELFLKEIDQIPLTTPIYVVGGTGFYFLALEKGLFEIAEASLELKAQVELELNSEGGAEKLLEEIRKSDPQHAQKLHVNDRYRISRAVEILRSNPSKNLTQALAEKQSSKGLEGSIQKIGLKWETAELEMRIRQRTQKMLKAGLIEETESLLKKGLEKWAPLRSVGYKETVQFLKGELAQDQLEEQIVISTRQLAKRQRTWFQRDQDIQWLEYNAALRLT